MAVFPPFFPDLCEVRVEQTLPGNVDAVSVLFVERSGAAAFSVEAEEIILSVKAFYEAFIVSLSELWSIDSIRVIDRSEEAGEEVINSIIAASGGSSANAMPTQNTICVTWRTASSGRRYRGRTNLSGWTEASSDADGDFNASAADTVLEAALDLRDALVADGHSLRVLSRGNTSPPAPEAWAAFHTEVTNARVNREWDVLRSRRR